jgi:hypothetical protein
MEQEMARTMSIQGSTREEMMGDGKQMIKSKVEGKGICIGLCFHQPYGD